ncbi:MAG TPA: 50S ribosomal protein L3 N(5)-glutamine methyltransferase [Steroidobacteraceae bacterium]|jgi:ribosomal protein L3 glutamine methyltransferase|nr:50S ribosomal protein L3 N(5)-glutamine methyltransferase [Steroidobacteraceae bacterium]
MNKVSHKQRPVTVQQLIARGARRLQRARVFFGHGTDNAWDESAALVWHALRLPTPHAGIYGRTTTPGQQARARELLTRRIRERMPAVYLTGMTWFAGLQFKIDGRALIPRSPLAELIERRYAPWVDARRVGRVLDIGTGSGCIAIATAKMFPKVRVDALDVSAAALGLAAENVRRHRLGRRVRLLESDYFGALNDERYDIIISNPPYVGAREMRSLPAEYRHEPRLALASGKDGMDAVRVILKEAGRHLTPGGILIVEVGNTEAAVRRAFNRLPFTWLTFERGGGGVFMLTAAQLGSQG